MCIYTLWKQTKKNLKISQGGCPIPPNVPKLGVSGVKDTATTNKDLGMSCYIQVEYSVFSAASLFGYFCCNKNMIKSIGLYNKNIRRHHNMLRIE